VGEPFAGLEYDAVVQSEDPGAIEYYPGLYYNLNRQIVSTRAGLDSVDSLYAVKMRTDTQIVGRKVTALLSEAEDASLFSRKILALDLFFRDPRKYKWMLFHIGDIFQIGKTKDLQDLWSIPLAPEPETSRWNLGKFSIFNECPELMMRYVPEQYIFVAFLAKHNIDASLIYPCELDLEKSVLSELLISENFSIFTYEELGLRIPERLLTDMHPRDIYDKNTLKKANPISARKELKRKIFNKKLLLIRRFVNSPKMWKDFVNYYVGIAFHTTSKRPQAASSKFSTTPDL
jgi:hypothetical protein